MELEDRERCLRGMSTHESCRPLRQHLAHGRSRLHATLERRQLVHAFGSRRPEPFLL